MADAPASAHAGVEGGGQREDINRTRRPVLRNTSASNLAATGRITQSYRMSASRVDALRQSVNGHHDSISKLLLSSKESLEKRSQIEAAFRVCKEAFVELSAAYFGLLDSSAALLPLSQDFKDCISKMITEAFDTERKRASVLNSEARGANTQGLMERSFVDAVRSSSYLSRVHVRRTKDNQFNCHAKGRICGFSHVARNQGGS